MVGDDNCEAHPLIATSPLIFVHSSPIVAVSSLLTHRPLASQRQVTALRDVGHSGISPSRGGRSGGVRRRRLCWRRRMRRIVARWRRTGWRTPIGHAGLDRPKARARRETTWSLIRRVTTPRGSACGLCALCAANTWREKIKQAIKLSVCLSVCGVLYILCRAVARCNRRLRR